jgi:hypothetical protein
MVKQEDRRYYIDQHLLSNITCGLGLGLGLGVRFKQTSTQSTTS